VDGGRKEMRFWGGGNPILALAYGYRDLEDGDGWSSVLSVV